jgi:hypothetical protein
VTTRAEQIRTLRGDLAAREKAREAALAGRKPSELTPNEAWDSAPSMEEEAARSELARLEREEREARNPAP